MSEEGTQGSITHNTQHDLESLFWVMWIMSVNTTGPYNQRRKWADSPKEPGAHQGNIREPADAIGQDRGVPIWATPGLHAASQAEVFHFKRSIPEHQFIGSMTGYWADGRCGKVFKDGMRKLREHFVWVELPNGSYQPPKTITPETFVTILASMRDAIPCDQDHPTEADVEEARKRYSKLLGDPDEELATSLLEVPAPSLLMKASASGSRKSGSRGIGTMPTVKRLMNTSSKRKAMETLSNCSGSSQDSKRSKRSRGGGKGTGGEPSESKSKKSSRSSKSKVGQDVSSDNKPTKVKSSKPRTRK